MLKSLSWLGCSKISNRVRSKALFCYHKHPAPEPWKKRTRYPFFFLPYFPPTKVSLHFDDTSANACQYICALHSCIEKRKWEYNARTFIGFVFSCKRLLSCGINQMNDNRIRIQIKKFVFGKGEKRTIYKCLHLCNVDSAYITAPHRA